MEVEWGAPAAWANRSAEFGALCEYDDGRPIVAMEFLPTQLHDRWAKLREVWLELPPHPCILDAVAPDDPYGLLLRYAALNWNHPHLHDENRSLAVRKVAAWGAQLVSVFELLRESARDHLGLFWNPLIKIDLGDHVRLAFLPTTTTSDELPPELLSRKPKWTERTLVYIVGRALARIATPQFDSPMRAVLQRCLMSDPGKRYKSLEQLVLDCRAIAKVTPMREAGLVSGWWKVEEGLGWLEVGNYAHAEACFIDASRYTETRDLADWGYVVACRKQGKSALGSQRAAEVNTGTPESFSQNRILYDRWSNAASQNTASTSNAVRPTIRPAGWATRRRVAFPSDYVDFETFGNRPWALAEPDGLRREAAHDFVGALAVYRSVHVLHENRAAVCTARARVHLHLHELGHAIDFARRALADEPQRAETLAILATALLAHGDHTEALAIADRLAELTGVDGAGPYLRGKCLLALGRLLDARAAFELAATTGPHVAEAMLLRREVDRTLAATGRAVGSQHAPIIEIPDSLAALRDILVSGDHAAAIAALDAPAYRDDPDAQLVCARLCSFDRQLDRAEALYDRLSLGPEPRRHAALIGKATILFERGSLESSLALFDQLCVEQPNNLDASEGRARVLDKLGRLGEAAAEYRRFVALGTARSDIRVRAAQLWLEQNWR